MLSKLQYLFLPHEKNNQKAKALHLSSLFFLLFFIVSFQAFLTLVLRFHPGVLGFATNINSRELLRLTNKERVAKGLKPLKENKLLVEAATRKASAMFTFGCWSHNCNDKSPWWFFKNVGYRYLYAGENLARDFSDSSSVVKAWMESPTHRDNILGEHYEEVGFAVVNGVLNGEETTLIVQLFGTQGGEPLLASGEKGVNAQVEGVRLSSKKPVVSSFILSKDFSIALISFLIILLGLDTLLIYQRQTVRISGKSFIHLSFFIIILISILLSFQGQIL